MAMRFAPGRVLRISTPEKKTAYAVMLATRPHFAFYRDDQLETSNGSTHLTGEPVFILPVHKSAYATDGWGTEVARIDKDGLPNIPPTFRQNALNSNDCHLDHADGSSTPARPEECFGLERTSVWEAHHVESRIDDYYAGRPNTYAEQERLKLPSSHGSE